MNHYYLLTNFKRNPNNIIIKLTIIKLTIV